MRRLFVAVVCVGALAWAGWALAGWGLPATDLSPAGQDSQDPQLVGDATGVTTIVYARQNGAIFTIDARRAAGGVWSAATVISDALAQHKERPGPSYDPRVRRCRHGRVGTRWGEPVICSIYVQMR